MEIKSPFFRAVKGEMPEGCHGPWGHYTAGMAGRKEKYAAEILVYSVEGLLKGVSYHLLDEREGEKVTGKGGKSFALFPVPVIQWEKNKEVFPWSLT